MRLFDDDHIGCFLDAIGHRVERTAETETKIVDLTLRVQPFTPALAVSLDPDVRALLFTMTDAQPKPKIKSIAFALPIPRQMLTIRAVPEIETGLALHECEITRCRARTEKGVDGFALVFHVAYGPASPAELEYVCEWLTQQRAVTFLEQAPALDFGPLAEEPLPPPKPARRRTTPIEPGDPLRPGVHAEH